MCVCVCVCVCETETESHLTERQWLSVLNFKCITMATYTSFACWTVSITANNNNKYTVIHTDLWQQSTIFVCLSLPPFLKALIEYKTHGNWTAKNLSWARTHTHTCTKTHHSRYMSSQHYKKKIFVGKKTQKISLKSITTSE